MTTCIFPSSLSPHFLWLLQSLSKELSRTFVVSGPVIRRWALSLWSDCRWTVWRWSVETSPGFPSVPADPILFIPHHFLLVLLRHNSITADSPQPAAAYAQRTPQVGGGGLLSVHGVPVAFNTTPHSLHRTQALALQHLFQAGARAAGLAVAVSPGHQAVEALGVWGKTQRCCNSKITQENNVSRQSARDFYEENVSTKARFTCWAVV